MNFNKLKGSRIGKKPEKLLEAVYSARPKSFLLILIFRPIKSERLDKVLIISMENGFFLHVVCFPQSTRVTTNSKK